MEIHLIFSLPDNLAVDFGPGTYQEIAADMARQVTGRAHHPYDVTPLHLRSEIVAKEQQVPFQVGQRVCRPRQIGDVATWRNIMTGTVTRVSKEVNPTDPCGDGCGRLAGVHLDRSYFVHWDDMTKPGSYGYPEQGIKPWDGEYNPWPLKS